MALVRRFFPFLSNKAIAMTIVPLNFPGTVNQVSIDFTLAAGTVTIQLPIKRWRPVGIVPTHASAIAAESIGVVGTPDSQGYFTGDLVLESSEGASTTTGIVTLQGF